MASVCTARNRFSGLYDAVTPFCSWLSAGVFFPVFEWSFFPAFKWICFGAANVDKLGEALVELDGVTDVDGM